MQRNRRRFLKCAAAGVVAAGAGAGWVATSKRRAARWIRTMIADARRSIAPAPVKPDPNKWSDNDVTICWLGHATMLINFYGINILTDPAFGSRVGISLGLGTVGPKRFIAPALRISELPPIDVLLLSHAHMDHMDLPSLQKFRPDTFTVTARVTKDLLADARLHNITELSWKEHATFENGKGQLQIEAVQVKHWGQRWPSELERGYNGYILRREDKGIIFGGDTALTEAFKALRSSGPFDAAIMPIGAYRPWIRNHCTPEEAVEMTNWACAHYIVPMHHQTFKLSDEPMDEPIQRLQSALTKEPERVALTRVGESFVCPKA